MAKTDSSKFGAAAERYAADKYGLQDEQERSEWADRSYKNGNPVQIKACKKGSGEFRLWEKDHHRLTVSSGWYVFIEYVPRGNGIEVKRCKRRKATTVTDWCDWFQGNHKRGQREAHLSPDTVF